MVTRLMPGEKLDVAGQELLSPQEVREAYAVERRRPDRIETPNPHLIRIMREALPSAGPYRDLEDEDDGVPFFGIVMGVLLSIPFWMALAFLAWLAF
jgi:hypothetical protein